MLDQSESLHIGQSQYVCEGETVHHISAVTFCLTIGDLFPSLLIVASAKP